MDGLRAASSTAGASSIISNRFMSLNEQLEFAENHFQVRSFSAEIVVSCLQGGSHKQTDGRRRQWWF